MIGATRLAIDQDAAITDRRTEPFCRNAHALGHGFDANPAMFAAPARSLRLYSQSGSKPDALDIIDEMAKRLSLPDIIVAIIRHTSGYRHSFNGCGISFLCE